MRREFPPLNGYLEGIRRRDSGAAATTLARLLVLIQPGESMQRTSRRRRRVDPLGDGGRCHTFQSDGQQRRRIRMTSGDAEGKIGKRSRRVKAKPLRHQ